MPKHNFDQRTESMSQRTVCSQSSLKTALASRWTSSSQGAVGARAEVEIETPRREALLLSPTALVQVGASPHSKRYLSMRKIDFSLEAKKTCTAARKLSFRK